MVDTVTQFCSVALLKTQSTRYIWNIILEKWVVIYAGPPDYLSVDQGSAYKSAYMKENED